jgi:endonuclease/exonuclease/phosphatase family metal-dependent hydrolase
MIRTLLSTLLLIASSLSVAAEETAKQIKVATYNIRFANPGDGKDIWPNRKESVIASARENDILGMQEVTEPQFRDLRDALPEFDSYGVGRDDGKSGGEHAPIFFRKDRFEPLEKGTFWLSETPEQVGKKGWDAALPRTCTWMLLRDTRSGQKLYVANTHFDHRGSQARTESAKLMAKRIDEASKDLPVVVLGDFNCLPASEPYNALAAVFTDARKASQTEPTGPASTWNGFREIAPDRIIDHVFVRSIDVLQLSTLNPKTAEDRFASDHLPVQIIIQLDSGK